MSAEPQWRCEWPGCAAEGDPWEDAGWCWWPRKYLWLPEGFFCPEHTRWIEETRDAGGFDDWPLDRDPKVLEFLEEAEHWHDLDSPEGREIAAEIRRSGFHVVGGET
jgi:hypothetical protein